MATPAEHPTDRGLPTPDSSLPGIGARVLAFASIVFGGVCGGLIGWAVTDLQCEGACSTPTGIGALVGALVGAGGVAVIAVLGLRAMAEWKAIERQRRHGLAPDA
jgi:hypothetical protein